MMRLAFVLAVVSGCGLWDNNPPPPCNYAAEALPATMLRDPSSGQCQTFTGGCDNQCGPCAGAGQGIAYPDWGACTGSCEALDEATCLATASCHAAYRDVGAATATYWGCWEMPPSGPREGGTCSTYDAQTCSEHDDCVSVFNGNAAPGTADTFERCAAEAAANSCAGVTCGTNQICAIDSSMNSAPECVGPDVAGCNGTPGQISCTMVEPACPAGTTRGYSNGCPTNYCIPNGTCPLPACTSLTDETSCKARSDCDAVYQGSNCTCDSNGCTCQTETYLRCEMR